MDTSDIKADKIEAGMILSGPMTLEPGVFIQPSPLSEDEAKALREQFHHQFKRTVPRARRAPRPHAAHEAARVERAAREAYYKQAKREQIRKVQAYKRAKYDGPRDEHGFLAPPRPRTVRPEEECFSGHFGPRGRCEYGTVQCTRHLDRPAKKENPSHPLPRSLALVGVGAIGVWVPATLSGGILICLLCALVAFVALLLRGMVLDVLRNTIPASEVEEREKQWWLTAELKPMPEPSPNTLAWELDRRLADERVTQCAEGHPINPEALRRTKARKPCGCPDPYHCARLGHIHTFGSPDCQVCGESA